MALSSYLSIGRRWWWTLLVATWIAALAGWLVASQIAPTYEAKTKLLVGPINTDLDTLRAGGQLVQTYSELVTSQPVLESTIQELDLPYSAGQLRADVRTTADDVTRFLTIRVQDGDAERAADIANSLASELIQLTSSGTTRPEGEVQVTEFADAPSSSVAPQVSLIVLVAAAGGLVAALLLVILIEYFANTVRTREDLRRLTGFTYLGSVPQVKGDRTEVPSIAPVDSPAGAAYRLIDTKLGLSSTDHPPASVVVLGAERGEPGPGVALDLAGAMAAAGRRITLIDADGELSVRLGWASQKGLGDAASGSGDIEPIDFAPRLGILPIGQVSAAATIEPDGATALVARLRADGIETIVIDGGSAQGSPAALVWARVAEAVVLTAIEDRTGRDQITYASESLRLVDAAVAGVVLLERRRVGSGRWRRRGRGPVAPAVATVAADPTPPISQARPLASGPERITISSRTGKDDSREG